MKTDFFLTLSSKNFVKIQFDSNIRKKNLDFSI